MEYASTVDIGARKRRSGGINEDSIATAVLENHHRQTARPVGVFVLGDGVGGESSGDVASSLATSVIRKRLTEALLGSGTEVFERFDIDAYRDDVPTVDDGEEPGSVLSKERIQSAIQEGIDTAHQHVQEFARQIDGRPATTIVVGVYYDGQLHYGWVGDSRIYLINTTHEDIQQLTRDHAVTNELLERGEIDDEEYARVHGDATAITNAIGGSPHGKPTVDVEFGTANVYGDDLIMLTSDGLIDAFPDIKPLRERYLQADDTEAVRQEIRETLVTDDEILDVVLEADDLYDAVEALVEFANDRGGKDNLSITLARDPTADPAPDSGSVDETADAEAATDQQTAAAAPADDGSDAGTVSTAESSETAGAGAESTSDEAEGVDVLTVGDCEPPTAAITIAGEETVFEVGDGISIGHDKGREQTRPDIDIVVDDDIVEDNHARIEFDDDEDHWRVRDTSSSGTYVEVNEGEWALLLSNEGAEFHRQHGFDPGAAVDHELNETHRLEDGTAFSLEDPRNERPITLQFFTSVDRARDRIRSRDGSEGSHFDRFLV